MKEAETAQEVDRLQRQISRLGKLNQIFLQEMAERGKELEKLKLLYDLWKNQLPEGLQEKIDPVFFEYVRRCTIQKTARQMSG